MVELPLLLAHEGGWDEALVLLGPVIVYFVIRHMGKQEPAAPEAQAAEPPASGSAQTDQESPVAAPDDDAAS